MQRQMSRSQASQRSRIYLDARLVKSCRPRCKYEARECLPGKESGVRRVSQEEKGWKKEGELDEVFSFRLHQWM